jgi:hypothetical protein
MSKSWMMVGGRMQTNLHAGRAQTVGSRTRLSGRVLPIQLSVEKIVTERVPRHPSLGKRPDGPGFGDWPFIVGREMNVWDCGCGVLLAAAAIGFS